MTDRRRFADFEDSIESKIDRVRTMAGVRKYKAPIGTPIVADPVTGKLRAAISKAEEVLTHTVEKRVQQRKAKDVKKGDTFVTRSGDRLKVTKIKDMRDGDMEIWLEGDDEPIYAEYDETLKFEHEVQVPVKKAAAKPPTVRVPEKRTVKKTAPAKKTTAKKTAPARTNEEIDAENRSPEMQAGRDARNEESLRSISDGLVLANFRSTKSQRYRSEAKRRLIQRGYTRENAETIMQDVEKEKTDEGMQGLYGAMMAAFKTPQMEEERINKNIARLESENTRFLAEAQRSAGKRKTALLAAIRENQKIQNQDRQRLLFLQKKRGGSPKAESGPKLSITDEGTLRREHEDGSYDIVWHVKDMTDEELDKYNTLLNTAFHAGGSEKGRHDIARNIQEAAAEKRRRAGTDDGSYDVARVKNEARRVAQASPDPETVAELAALNSLQPEPDYGKMSAEEASLAKAARMGLVVGMMAEDETGVPAKITAINSRGITLQQMHGGRPGATFSIQAGTHGWDRFMSRNAPDSWAKEVAKARNEPLKPKARNPFPPSDRSGEEFEAGVAKADAERLMDAERDRYGDLNPGGMRRAYKKAVASSTKDEILKLATEHNIPVDPARQHELFRREVASWDPAKRDRLRRLLANTPIGDDSFRISKYKIIQEVESQQTPKSNDGGWRYANGHFYSGSTTLPSFTPSKAVANDLHFDLNYDDTVDPEDMADRIRSNGFYSMQPSQPLEIVDLDRAIATFEDRLSIHQYNAQNDGDRQAAALARAYRGQIAKLRLLKATRKAETVSESPATPKPASASFDGPKKPIPTTTAGIKKLFPDAKGGRNLWHTAEDANGDQWVTDRYIMIKTPAEPPVLKNDIRGEGHTPAVGNMVNRFEDGWKDELEEPKLVQNSDEVAYYEFANGAKIKADFYDALIPYGKPIMRSKSKHIGFERNGELVAIVAQYGKPKKG